MRSDRRVGRRARKRRGPLQYRLPILPFGLAQLAVTAALFSPFCCHPSIGYITDQHAFNLLTGESIRYRIISSLRSGTRVEVISQNETTGYSKVRLDDGTEGFVRSRYLQSEPPATVKLMAASERLKELERSPTTVALLLAKTMAETALLRKRHHDNLTRLRSVEAELAELQRLSTDVIAVTNERDTLRDRVEYLEALASESRRAQASVQAETYDRWLLLGAALSLSGLLFGVAFSRVGHYFRRSAL